MSDAVGRFEADDQAQTISLVLKTGLGLAAGALSLATGGVAGLAIGTLVATGTLAVDAWTAQLTADSPDDVAAAYRTAADQLRRTLDDDLAVLDGQDRSMVGQIERPR